MSEARTSAKLMTIPIAFVGTAPERERRVALLNLLALIMEIPLAHLVLLDWLSATIELQRLDARRSTWPRAGEAIEVDLDSLQYSRVRHARRTVEKQHRALSALERKVVYRLDRHFRFTSQRAWRRAARDDLRHAMNSAGTSSEIWALVAGRERDCAARGASAYIHRLVLTFQLAVELVVSPESQLLGDVLVMSNSRSGTASKSSRISDEVQALFPRTYPLARQFEQRMEAQAIEVASARFPALASSPLAAMGAVRSKLEIKWPAGLAPTVPVR